MNNNSRDRNMNSNNNSVSSYSVRLLSKKRYVLCLYNCDVCSTVSLFKAIMKTCELFNNNKCFKSALFLNGQNNTNSFLAYFYAVY